MLRELETKGGGDGAYDNGRLVSMQSRHGQQILAGQELDGFQYANNDCEKKYQIDLDYGDFIQQNGYLPQKCLLKALAKLEKAKKGKLPSYQYMKQYGAMMKRSQVIDPRIEGSVEEFFRNDLRRKQTLLDSEQLAIQQLRMATGLTRTDALLQPRTSNMFALNAQQFLQAQPQGDALARPPAPPPRRRPEPNPNPDPDDPNIPIPQDRPPGERLPIHDPRLIQQNPINGRRDYIVPQQPNQRIAPNVPPVNVVISKFAEWNEEGKVVDPQPGPDPNPNPNPVPPNPNPDNPKKTDPVPTSIVGPGPIPTPPIPTTTIIPPGNPVSEINKKLLEDLAKIKPRPTPEPDPIRDTDDIIIDEDQTVKEPGKKRQKKQYKDIYPRDDPIDDGTKQLIGDKEEEQLQQQKIKAKEEEKKQQIDTTIKKKEPVPVTEEEKKQREKNIARHGQNLTDQELEGLREEEKQQTPAQQKQREKDTEERDKNYEKYGLWLTDAQLRQRQQRLRRDDEEDKEEEDKEDKEMEEEEKKQEDPLPQIIPQQPQIVPQDLSKIPLDLQGAAFIDRKLQKKVLDTVAKEMLPSQKKVHNVKEKKQEEKTNKREKKKKEKKNEEEKKEESQQQLPRPLDETENDLRAWLNRVRNEMDQMTEGLDLTSLTNRLNEYIRILNDIDREDPYYQLKYDIMSKAIKYAKDSVELVTKLRKKTGATIPKVSIPKDARPPPAVLKLVPLSAREKLEYARRTFGIGNVSGYEPVIREIEEEAKKIDQMQTKKQLEDAIKRLTIELHVQKSDNKRRNPTEQFRQKLLSQLIQETQRALEYMQVQELEASIGATILNPQRPSVYTSGDIYLITKERHYWTYWHQRERPSSTRFHDETAQVDAQFHILTRPMITEEERDAARQTRNSTIRQQMLATNELQSFVERQRQERALFDQEEREKLVSTRAAREKVAQKTKQEEEEIDEMDSIEQLNAKMNELKERKAKLPAVVSSATQEEAELLAIERLLLRVQRRLEQKYKRAADEKRAEKLADTFKKQVSEKEVTEQLAEEERKRNEATALMKAKLEREAKEKEAAIEKRKKEAQEKADRIAKQIQIQFDQQEEQKKEDLAYTENYEEFMRGREKKKEEVKRRLYEEQLKIQKKRDQTAEEIKKLEEENIEKEKKLEEEREKQRQWLIAHRRIKFNEDQQARERYNQLMAEGERQKLLSEEEKKKLEEIAKIEEVPKEQLNQIQQKLKAFIKANELNIEKMSKTRRYNVTMYELRQATHNEGPLTDSLRARLVKLALARFEQSLTTRNQNELGLLLEQFDDLGKEGKTGALVEFVRACKAYLRNKNDATTQKRLRDAMDALISRNKDFTDEARDLLAQSMQRLHRSIRDGASEGFMILRRQAEEVGRAITNRARQIWQFGMEQFDNPESTFNQFVDQTRQTVADYGERLGNYAVSIFNQIYTYAMQVNRSIHDPKSRLRVTMDQTLNLLYSVLVQLTNVTLDTTVNGSLLLMNVSKNWLDMCSNMMEAAGYAAIDLQNVAAPALRKLAEEGLKLMKGAEDLQVIDEHISQNSIRLGDLIETYRNHQARLDLIKKAEEARKDKEELEKIRKEQAEIYRRINEENVQRNEELRLREEQLKSWERDLQKKRERQKQKEIDEAIANQKKPIDQNDWQARSDARAAAQLKALNDRTNAEAREYYKQYLVEQGEIRQKEKEEEAKRIVEKKMKLFGSLIRNEEEEFEYELNRIEQFGTLKEQQERQKKAEAKEKKKIKLEEERRKYEQDKRKFEQETRELFQKQERDIRRRAELEQKQIQQLQEMINLRDRAARERNILTQVETAVLVDRVLTLSDDKEQLKAQDRLKEGNRGSRTIQSSTIKPIPGAEYGDRQKMASQRVFNNDLNNVQRMFEQTHIDEEYERNRQQQQQRQQQQYVDELAQRQSIRQRQDLEELRNQRQQRLSTVGGRLASWLQDTLISGFQNLTMETIEPPAALENDQQNIARFVRYVKNDPDMDGLRQDAQKTGSAASKVVKDARNNVHRLQQQQDEDNREYGGHFVRQGNVNRFVPSSGGTGTDKNTRARGGGTITKEKKP